MINSLIRNVPVKFMEKNRVGDQTLCSAFSPGIQNYLCALQHILNITIFLKSAIYLILTIVQFPFKINLFH